jgi:release factor glutamine methyltransferase
MNSRIQKISEPPPPQPRVWTSLDLIKWTTDFFKKKEIESPRLEAELLLAEVLGCPRIKLYVDFEKPVPQEKLANFREFVKRRGETREPLQYILGHTQFIDLKLKVTPAVLIPRPETEILALWAVEKLKEAVPQASSQPEISATETLPLTPIRVLDLCTGSGCLALYIASKAPNAQLVATDLSAEPLAIAAENALALKLESRVVFKQGDLFEALGAEQKNSFDLLVANPPYIDPAAKAGLQPEVRDHEPAQALFAPESGLACLRSIIEGASDWMLPGAWLGLEFGVGQAESLRKLAEENSRLENVEIKPDQVGLPRFVIARRKL